jgi:hypothetical protein
VFIRKRRPTALSLPLSESLPARKRRIHLLCLRPAVWTTFSALPRASLRPRCPPLACPAPRSPVPASAVPPAARTRRARPRHDVTEQSSSLRERSAPTGVRCAGCAKLVGRRVPGRRARRLGPSASAPSVRRSLAHARAAQGTFSQIAPFGELERSAYLNIRRGSAQAALTPAQAEPTTFRPARVRRRGLLGLSKSSACLRVRERVAAGCVETTIAHIVIVRRAPRFVAL